MSSQTKPSEMLNCPSCNQAIYHVSYVLSDNMRFEHVICRHCKKQFVQFTWPADGQWNAKVFTVAGTHK